MGEGISLVTLTATGLLDPKVRPQPYVQSSHDLSLARFVTPFGGDRRWAARKAGHDCMGAVGGTRAFDQWFYIHSRC